MLELSPVPEQEYLGELSVLDETGDTRLQWNRNNPEEVQTARERFDELKARGYLAYRVDKKGNQGEVIHSFDPKAERIILHAQMIGG